MCKHSSSFKEYGIKISEENLISLPENGIPNNLNEIDEIFDETNEAAHVGVKVLEEILEKDDYHAFIEEPEKDRLQNEKIKQRINWPQINPTPINEFEFHGICSLLFPKLFPHGLGDPTKKSRRRMVSETQGKFKNL